MPDANDTIDGLAKDWDEFKNTNDQILERKADGKAVSDLEEKLDKINEKIDQAVEIKSRMDKLEAFARRAPRGETKGELNDAQIEHKAAFEKFLRKGEENGLPEIEKKALSVNSDPDGGYTVHADMNGRLVQRIFDRSPQANLLVAGLGVGILTVPLVASVSEDALQSVPSSLREASYGVGARKVSTVTRIVIPAAVSGLVAAGIIAVSRALAPNDTNRHKSDGSCRSAPRRGGPASPPGA